ncbi:MAG TPA: tetratricopeptide repeat protein [Polyangiales bacterium]|nr:tetratricopeptide repeat protein [Polyangiales bacterium]
MSLLRTAPPSAAQDSTAETSGPDAQNVTERARAHFERGVEHYSEGDYDAALAEFQRSYELSPTYKLLFNLAQVQMERRDYAAAASLYSDYLRSGGTAISEERSQAVEQDLAYLNERIADVELDVDVRDAQIFVNGASVGTSPLQAPLRVNVGSCLVRVEKAGYAPFEQRLSVAGADRRRVSVELKSITAPTPVVPRAVQPLLRVVDKPDMTPAWISLGAALVLGGATATFGVLSLNAREHQDQVLASYPGRPSELMAARDRLQTFAALTDGFAAASAAAGLVGLYFLWSPPSSHETVPTTEASVRLAATPAGATLSGTF